MNRREAAERNSALIRRRLSDETVMWKDLAAEFHISVATARRIWKEHQEDVKRFFVEDTTDHLLIVAEKQQQFSMLRAELFSAALRARRNRQASAEVGALKAIAALHDKEIELLQRTGLLPNDLGVVRVSLEMRKVTDAFIGIFVKFMPADVAEEAERELLDVLRPGLSRQVIAGEALELTQG